MGGRTGGRRAQSLIRYVHDARMRLLRAAADDFGCRRGESTGSLSA
jgi:hypothetical protein